MNKENNRSAAGLRRSAIAERKRLKEEWLALKGVDTENKENKKMLTKKHNNIPKPHKPKIKEYKKPIQMVTCEALRGVVALVEVGAESRALVLRAGLMALGATVVPTWSPLVTHLIWTHGGCSKIRAKARALACNLVSPLWVEACASAAQKLPERLFPAPTRPSDLPSPATLRQFLKKAEQENIPLADFLSDSRESEEENFPRLRISSDTESMESRKLQDQSTDNSQNQSKDNDTTNNDSPNIAHRVNTEPRGALPRTPAARAPAKSRRKLFTHKEDMVAPNNRDICETSTAACPKRTQLTQQERRAFIQAGRIAKKLIKTPIKTARTESRITATQRQKMVPRIVLTGMSKSERREVCNALKTLNCKIKSKVTFKTTHIIFGSCQEDSISQINECVKPRTVNALLGAVRGCRVLRTQWAIDSAKEGQWLPHYGYEVPQFLKMSTKARVERTALGRMHSEYAFDVFNGIIVKVQNHAPQKAAVIDLLRLCGGHIQDGDCDITIGQGEDEISSKWVFDSVAAGRMRTTRRYVNKDISNSVADNVN